MNTREAQEFKNKRHFEIYKIILSDTPKTSITEYWNEDITWITSTSITKINEIYVHYTERNNLRID